jgi:hypothetical protein
MSYLDKGLVMNQWGTPDEKLFLRHLGFCAPVVAWSNQKSRADLLALYLEAAERRTDWGQIDKAAVMAHARELLGVYR